MRHEVTVKAMNRRSMAISGFISAYCLPVWLLSPIWANECACSLNRNICTHHLPDSPNYSSLSRRSLSGYKAWKSYSSHCHCSVCIFILIWARFFLLTPWISPQPRCPNQGKLPCISRVSLLSLGLQFHPFLPLLFLVLALASAWPFPKAVELNALMKN